MNRRSFLGSMSVAAITNWFLPGCTAAKDRVVVYCAQDEAYATEVFAQFQRETGLIVQPKFDTEANKSVSLTAELLAEQSLPRCDVHWNNEPLGSVRLQHAGAYEGEFRSFAARGRVLIVNNELVPAGEEPRSLLELSNAKWKGRVAMAKPIFGTTATHMACLFAALGSEFTKEFLTKLKTNEVQIVAGNKQSAVRTARGEYAVGLTDTDDAIIEINAGKPVRVVYLDDEKHAIDPRLGTLFLPNTLAEIKGGPNPEAAQKLIAFLTRPDIEDRLAAAGGFQIPLHPNSQAKLHSALRTPRQVKAMDVDFTKAAEVWEEAQTFVRNLFTI